MRLTPPAAALGLAAALFVPSHAAAQNLTAAVQNPQAPFAQGSGVVIGGKSWPSWQAWNSSAGFRAQGRRCGTAPIDLATAAPSFAATSDCNFSQTNTLAQYDPGAVYTIQVVVHVIETNSGTGHLSASMVQYQIDILNEDFRALSGTPGSGGVDTKIQFELATLDPGGSPTTGITYTTNNTWFNDSGSYWTSLAWDPDQYLNIYTNDAGGNLGYVPYLPPSGNSGNSSDRVVILYSSFGRNSSNWPYHQGRTTTHEVGHYLGLFHTFEGGCGGGGCSTSGDLICDTNAESSANWGCATSSTSCGSSDPVRNYMDYSDDTCMTGFTADQANRMRCTLENWRPTLYTTGTTGPADDIYEENDNCSIAAVIGAGTDVGLNVAKTDEDYYAITLADGETLQVDLSFTNANGDIDCYLYGSAGINCGDKTNYLVRGFSSTDDESISWVNNTGATKTYWLQVNMYDSASNADDNSYDMTVTITAAPVSDDAFEDNDTCATPWPLLPGSYPNLTVRSDDEDYFEVDVPSGATIDVSALHTAATADIDIYLYAGVGDCVFDNWLVRGYTSTDDEQMSYTNNSGADGSYVIKVHIWNNSGPENQYDLIIDVTGGGPIASSFCTGEGTGGVCPCLNWSNAGSGEGCLNSQGHGAVLTANGSNSFAADDLSFTVTQARPGQPALLLQGSVAISTPFKDGILCMGNPTRRLEVVGLDGTGSGSSTSSIVTEGNIPGPGVSRFYQMWYRDPGPGSPCSTGSNFSQGLQVDWQ
ncbi:MAG: pre-peptidase C-terminal domain-containing protein [Planctomycetes bacterium]|nr:pre-peptidase C-terminal domain-containing protein [Planctomycetota bacterium]